MGRDLNIDFMADTGDDMAVSRAVAQLMFPSYELPDPDHPGAFLVAPRGESCFSAAIPRTRWRPRRRSRIG